MSGASVNSAYNTYNNTHDGHARHHLFQKQTSDYMAEETGSSSRTFVPVDSNTTTSSSSSSGRGGRYNGSSVPSGDSLASRSEAATATTIQAVASLVVANAPQCDSVAAVANSSGGGGGATAKPAASTALPNRIAHESHCYSAENVKDAAAYSAVNAGSFERMASAESEQNGSSRNNNNNNDGANSKHSNAPVSALKSASRVDSISEKNYAGRFDTYSDYLSIVADSPPTDDHNDDARQRHRQRQNNDGLDNENKQILSVHGTAATQTQRQTQTQTQADWHSLRPPQLRSTYKSEPLISTVSHITSRIANMEEGETVDVRNSYSRTLENALFYSQAVEQIRELDIADASNPYAAAVPRSRPGKENIRQRRAKNVIASREVFSIVNTSSFIAATAADLPPMPDPRLAIERSRAMRSEPSFKQSNNSNNNHNHSQGSGGAASVPISKLLPRRTERKADAASLSSASGRSFGEFQPRRAGLDQPVPLTDDGRAESVKQRGAATPHTLSSSLHHRQTDSDLLGSENDDRDSSILASPQTTSHARRNRLSVASYFSSASAAAPAAHAEADNSSYNQRPTTGVPSKRQRRQHPLSSHSRKVATRLLMRAGLSRIAIRVARIGHGNAHHHHQQQQNSRQSRASEASFDADAMSERGVELDPNGLQELKAERRKQVKHIDEYGFMEFEGGDERETEHSQQYHAWRARQTGRDAQRLERQLRIDSADQQAPGSEAKWETLLASFDRATLRGSRKVKRLVQAGVPQQQRARFYYVLSGAADMARAGEYARLAALEELAIFEVIERDVPRCYPDHVMFAEADGLGQRRLRRILRAYAHHNSAVGYCQGMGRLAGLFLISGMGEEQAFWTMAAVIQNYVPRYYESDLGGLRAHTAAFEVMLQERNPRLHAHLAKQGCDALMYATPWFMTVFTLSLPWPAALRVWDLFVYRGCKALFRVALAITDLASAYLLEACPTIAELLGFLLHIPRGLVEADMLVAAAMRVKLSERHIERLTRASSTAL
ncbi:hypothetical protein IWW48_001755 [Coemansia sp. RSA 1200]|nr:hypothetical protein IWW48_001755 [Coemansia sp. RSA 1200]